MLQWAKTQLGFPQLVFLCLAGALHAESGVWLDVGFVKQEKNGCGAASIAMIMQYWQQQQRQPVIADAERIQQTLYSGKAHGIYASDLERYLDDHGYQTFAFRGGWSDLKEHLKKGRPLIVALKPPRQAEFHYVVVTGLDWTQDLVLTNDPAGRKLVKQTRFDFEKEWKATDNWTLLAVPRQQDAIFSSH
jgi:ABC-type bacteriocin/lantibiotic exporter with double-glycine peptidase domain